MRLKKIKMLFLLPLVGFFGVTEVKAEENVSVKFGSTIFYSNSLGEAISWANTYATSDCTIKVLKSNSYNSYGSIEWTNTNGNLTIDLGDNRDVVSTITTLFDDAYYGYAIHITAGKNVIGGYGTLNLVETCPLYNGIRVNTTYFNQNVSLEFKDKAYYYVSQNGGSENNSHRTFHANASAGGAATIVVNDGVFTSSSENGKGISMFVVSGDNANLYIKDGEFHLKAANTYYNTTTWGGIIDYASTGEGYVYDGYFDGQLWYSDAYNLSGFKIYGGKFVENKVVEDQYGYYTNHALSDFVASSKAVLGINETYNGYTYRYEVCDSSKATAIKDVTTDVANNKTKKFIENGKVVIVSNENRYDISGKITK